MCWKVADVMNQRIEFVARAHAGVESMSALCREFDISRPTGYRWLARFQEVGQFSELRERSRRPRRSPSQTSAEQEARVVALRQQFGWGAKKLHVLLAREGIMLSVRTINRIIVRQGLLDPDDSHPPATGRFERPAPNELWQVDFKGYFELTQGLCHPLSVLDDHSRFLVGLFALANQQAEPVHACLKDCFQTHGVPDALLMDHGTPWWSTTNGWGLTWLSVDLIRQGIRLYHGRIAHPQTQGKVERFHRTLRQELRQETPEPNLAAYAQACENIQQRYNYVRPHEALDMAVPATRYRPSPRPFDPCPPEWEYPAHVTVMRLNSQGMLPYGSQRYFVCGALPAEWVGVQRVGHLLLISFRHMYVREIDLNTGRSKAVLNATTQKV